jgi:hypothetical protein
MLAQPERSLDQQGGGMIEHGEIARVEHDTGGVAIAPFDANRARIARHLVSRPAGRAI